MIISNFTGDDRGMNLVSQSKGRTKLENVWREYLDLMDRKKQDREMYIVTIKYWYNNQLKEDKQTMQHI
jgi:hypothetical protein